jgi:hypothetical protein
MGTWGIGVFENDTACDFAANVADGGGVQALVQALDRVLVPASDYLRAQDADRGLAAAEIVARLKGIRGQRTAYTAEIDAWIERSSAPISEELLDKARRAIARILTKPSELVDLWMDSGDFEDWKRDVEEVSKRL